MLNKFILSVISLMVLCSCGGIVKNDSFWGVSESYEPFLWCSHQPDTIKKTLVFEFNDDAKRLLTRPVKLGLFKKELTKEGSERLVPINTKQVELYVDGVLSSDNTFRVDKNVEELEIAIVFPNLEPTRVHTWYIKVIDNGGLDIINDFEVSGYHEPTPIVEEVQVKTVKRANPLAVGVNSVIFVLVALFCLWVFVLRYIFFRRFRISLVSVGKEGQTMIPRRAKGFIRFVITNSPKRQSAFMDLLTGKIQYFVMPAEDGVTEDIEIEPFDKTSVRIEKGTKGVYAVTLSRLRIKKVGQPSEISEVINQQNRKTIKIQIQ